MTCLWDCLGIFRYNKNKLQRLWNLSPTENVNWIEIIWTTDKNVRRHSFSRVKDICYILLPCPWNCRTNNMMHDGLYFSGSLLGRYKQRTLYELLLFQRKCGSMKCSVPKVWWNKKKFERAQHSIFHCHKGRLWSAETLQSWEKYWALFTVLGGIFNASAAGWAKSIYYWQETLNAFYIKYYFWVLTVLWWNKIRNCGFFPHAFVLSNGSMWDLSEWDDELVIYLTDKNLLTSWKHFFFPSKHNWRNRI